MQKKADAFVFGSPVYYGGITSQMKVFLTKLFYSSPKVLEYKPVATIVSSRRAGSLLALSELNAPFLMHSCILVGSTYWNEIYGDNKEEMIYDYEGIQTIENMMNNLLWVSNCLKQIEHPVHKPIRHLNYISREYITLTKKEQNYEYKE